MNYKFILYPSFFFLTQIVLLFFAFDISLAQVCQHTDGTCCYVNPVDEQCTDYTTPGSCDSSCRTFRCPPGTKIDQRYGGNHTPICYWSGGPTPPPGGGGGGGASCNDSYKINCGPGLIRGEITGEVCQYAQLCTLAMVRQTISHRSGCCRSIHGVFPDGGDGLRCGTRPVRW